MEDLYQIDKVHGGIYDNDESTAFWFGQALGQYSCQRLGGPALPCIFFGRITGNAAHSSYIFLKEQYQEQYRNYKDAINE